MSFTHTFVDDVFISYRHLDNELLDEQGKGWIDNFDERFENILGGACQGDSDHQFEIIYYPT